VVWVVKFLISSFDKNEDVQWCVHPIMNSEHPCHGNFELSFGSLVSLRALSEDQHPDKSHFKCEIQKCPPGKCREDREYNIDTRVQVVLGQENSGTNCEDVRKDNDVGRLFCFEAEPDQESQRKHN
jgi:hypothetical protein